MEEKKNEIPYINDEQKIRISLSKRAYATMLSGMGIFEISAQATFINRIIKNFRDQAVSSVSMYLRHKSLEYERIIASSRTAPDIQKRIIACLIATEEEKVLLKVSSFLQNKDVSKLYHINKENMDFFLNDFEDSDRYKNRPGLYIKALLEEYSNLTFIEREKIILKDFYQTIEIACERHELLQIKTKSSSDSYIVYPLRILPDPLNVQDYLICYSKKNDDSLKREASFSMLRIANVKRYSRNAFLSKSEVSQLEKSISQKSVAFFLGDPERIEVRLNTFGKQWYQRRLYNRPEIAEEIPEKDIFVFSCPQLQALMYFLPFGENAEILQPEELRMNFKSIYEKACELYD